MNPLGDFLFQEKLAKSSEMRLRTGADLFNS
jgi:hypothetical protein